ncbi:NTP transferase domain-containing protein [Luteimonas sp. BDR2-5]|uniref:molybdenum cofactor guanylyltransferase n=1 Tax=Proluteimonas luteida TaxID=2878685 RepID=UPI001E3B9D37|nr:NTP transferase domain-containing protein [Luteimonas sp. BDR2-5]MCD9026990.1 NTP transferase domain-containing protein [Luteimonas sp. BDR2-5]
MSASHAPAFPDVTVGILAGGRASRLGGLDKAWLVRGGVPQVLRWQRRFAAESGHFLVSANRDLPRYAAHGLTAVPDRVPDAGPLSGLDALAAATATPWLLTLPVDLVDVNDCLLRTLVHHAGTHGAHARDADGVQPLVALWPVAALREATRTALASQDFAVRSLQQVLGMQCVRFDGVRFGNLNTPEDLDDAGIARD